jgi:hypothetical protein
MRRAQVVVYEADGRLADLLREPARKHRWWLREVRHAGRVPELLQPGGPAVLVLKVGRDLERELGLLEKVAWLYPDTATVVVGDADSAALADLAWDLGARLVLCPPLPRAHLPEIVAGLMEVPAETSPQGGEAEA